MDRTIKIPRPVMAQPSELSIIASRNGEAITIPQSPVLNTGSQIIYIVHQDPQKPKTCCNRLIRCIQRINTIAMIVTFVLPIIGTIVGLTMFLTMPQATDDDLNTDVPS